jgi:hypothetical protein
MAGIHTQMHPPEMETPSLSSQADAGVITALRELAPDEARRLGGIGAST